MDPHARWTRALPARRSAWLWTTSPGVPAGDTPMLVNGLPQLRPCGLPSGRIRFIGPLLGGLRATVPGFPFDRLAGRRVLVGSFGTVFARRPQWLRALAEAFRGSDWTLVLATGSVPVTALGPLPGNVLACPFVPQQDLLRHADALLTHGGMNSVLEAAHAGVPMLVRPRSREQRRTALRVAELGAGAVLERVGALRAGLERLVGHADTADRVREFSMLVRAAPAVAEAADQLLQLAHPRRMG
ncbi:nucleotide disphospho-sugar-binding domain-containing protein [Amycolatopsis sp. SID8362]|uniref:glycosyltransferase n=1 Tax=Amycolatopsis sp. SID8362 TaxID=2690346 RepID=UPI0028167A44|nr:nucleotide disphospho-sugar-binding domain-containing protein [Amycolatopsis sp. SID8362]